MAVYTKVSSSQMKILLDKYEVGNFLSMSEIQEGVENSNFKIITDKDNYILTIYEKRVNEKDLPYFINLMEHLNNKGVNCPKPLYDKYGIKFQEIKNKKSLLTTFLSGSSLKKINKDHCYELGKSLANFHLKGKNFFQKRYNDLGYKSWLNLFKQGIKSFDTDNEYDLQIFENIIIDTVNNWPENLPKGNIHADLFPNNVFFTNEKISGIIDFYFACYDLLAYDIAVCINSWCFNEKNIFIIDRAQSMISGYSSIKKLTNEEKDNLILLSKGAAIRFYLTRLFDWYNTPSNSNVSKLNPQEFYNKVLFFNSLKTLGLN